MQPKCVLAYQISSEEFVREFDLGQLGDNMDFFEWYGLYEFRLDILTKIAKLTGYSIPKSVVKLPSPPTPLPLREGGRKKFTNHLGSLYYFS